MLFFIQHVYKTISNFQSPLLTDEKDGRLAKLVSAMRYNAGLRIKDHGSGFELFSLNKMTLPITWIGSVGGNAIHIEG